MHIPLNEFELILNEKVLKSGLNLYNKSAIIEFTAYSNADMEAVLAGSREPKVRLEIKDQVVVKHGCSCSYKATPVCSHKVAVIFYILQGKLGLEAPALPPMPIQEKSEVQLYKEFLQTLSKEDLLAFVQYTSNENPSHKNKLIAQYGAEFYGTTMEVYRKQFKSIIKPMNRKSYWRMYDNSKGNLHEEIEPFLDAAQQALAHKNYNVVVNIAMAIMEESLQVFKMLDRYEYLDEFYIDCALKLLYQVAQKTPNKTLNSKIYDYCLQTFNNLLLINCIWRFNLIEITFPLIENEEEADEILRCLDSIGQFIDGTDYKYLKMEILKKFKSKDVLNTYVNQNLSNPLIRKQEIDKALALEDYERASMLIEGGIEQVNKSYGYEDQREWYSLMTEVAILQKDHEKLALYTQKLIHYDQRNLNKYLQLLQEKLPQKDWDNFILSFTQELKERNQWDANVMLGKVYVFEKRWDKLMELMDLHPSLYFLNKYSQYLMKDYGTWMVKMYETLIFEHMEENVGRKHYKHVCRALKKLIKGGYTDGVTAISNALKGKYPQRRALLEELGKL